MDIVQLMNMLSSSPNPQQMVQQMIGNNPQIKQSITQLKNMAGGKSPREFALQMAKQNNMPIEQITQFLDRMGIK